MGDDFDGSEYVLYDSILERQWHVVETKALPEALRLSG